MPPEEAERPYSLAEMATAEKLRRKSIVGSAEQVAARLKELAKGLELDELVVVTWTYDPAPRPSLLRTLGESLWFGTNRKQFYVIDIHFAKGWDSLSARGRRIHSRLSHRIESAEHLRRKTEPRSKKVKM